MATRTHSSIGCATERRLLEAAGEIFADRGYRAASIRQICQRAGGANVAAISYYFGGKEGLYAAVLRYAQLRAIEHYPSAGGLADFVPPAQRLHGHIRSLLLRFLDQGQPAWQGKLMTREMVEPTVAMDLVVESGIRPQFDLMAKIIRELATDAGHALSAEQVRHCAFSVVGQCIFYRHAQPVITRLHPAQRFERRDIDLIAEHITDFSLGAIAIMAGRGRAFAEPRKSGGPCVELKPIRAARKGRAHEFRRHQNARG